MVMKSNVPCLSYGCPTSLAAVTVRQGCFVWPERWTDRVVPGGRRGQIRVSSSAEGILDDHPVEIHSRLPWRAVSNPNLRALGWVPRRARQLTANRRR